jgi:integrase/recombinase XerD
MEAPRDVIIHPALAVDYAKPFNDAWKTMTTQISPSSYKIYEHDVQYFGDWVFNQDLIPHDLAYRDMCAYRDHLVSQYRSATAARMFAVARKFCTELVKAGYFVRNPCDGVRTIQTDDETPHTVLTEDEAEKLLSAPDIATLKGMRDYALLLLLVRVGLRREECAALNQADLQMNQKHHVAIVQHGKGNKRRTAKIPVDVQREIETWLAARAEAGIEIDAVFSSIARGNHPKAKRLRATDIYEIVCKYAEAVNIEGLTPHGLRATFITLCIEAGVPLTKVQYAAGHADPRTTERYQKRKLNLDKNAVDALYIRRKDG